MPSVVPAADAYWSLDLRDHAINLSLTAPTDTMQLMAIARNVAGAPIAGVTPTPVFYARDSARLAVSPTGLITARAVGTAMPIVVTWQYGTVTHVDTAYVTVTTTAPTSPLAALSVQPAPGDSAKWALVSFFDLFTDKAIVATATDVAGNPVPVASSVGGVSLEGIAVSYATSNPDVATVGKLSGDLSPGNVGQFIVRASTYAYGVRKSDSVTYTIGLPLLVFATIRNPESGGLPEAAPFVLTVGVGGIVDWTNRTQTPVTLHFTPAAGAPFIGGDGGDIIDLAPDADALREFDAPGTYQYRDATGQLLGSVVVKHEP